MEKNFFSFFLAINKLFMYIISTILLIVISLLIITLEVEKNKKTLMDL